MPPAIPAIGLAKGPTTGRTGGVTAIAPLAPRRAPGVAATDSRAEAPKAPRLLVSPSPIGFIPGLEYMPKAAPPELSIGAEADVAGADTGLEIKSSKEISAPLVGAEVCLDGTKSSKEMSLAIYYFFWFCLTHSGFKSFVVISYPASLNLFITASTSAPLAIASLALVIRG